MIIYTLMFALSVVFAYIAQANKSAVVVEDGGVKYRLNRLFLILSALVPIFFAGMRGAIADTGSYIHSFNEIKWDAVWDLITGKTDGKSPGFHLLEWLVKQVVDNYTVWLFIIAIFCVACLWVVFTKYSDSFALSVFLFFGTTSFSWMFNGMRQYIAVCALFLMFPLLLKSGNRRKDAKKLVIFIVLSILLYTIHSSAIVILPIYLLCRGNLFGRWKTLLILGFVAASAFVGPFTEFLSDLFSDASFGTVANDLQEYDGANILRLVIAAIPIFLGLYRIKQIKNDNEPVFNFCFNMSLINVCIWVPAVVISGNTFGRFAEYCSVFNLILYPMIINRYYGGKTRKVLTIGLLLAFAFWFYYQVKLTWGWPYLSEVIGNFY